MPFRPPTSEPLHRRVLLVGLAPLARAAIVPELADIA